jgi:ABC-type amino acid transport substrate-binding protein
MRRRFTFVLLCAAALAASAAADTGARTEKAERTKTIRVATDAQFDAAVRRLRWSGGTIVLRPRLYRRLVVGSRGRAPLRIVGTRGARV